MRRRRFDASLKVAFKELYTLFIVEETMFVKLVHIFTHFNQDVDLTRFRIEGKLCLRYLNHSSLNLLVIFIVKTSHSKTNSHVFKLTILVDCFTLKEVLDFPHVTSRSQLISKSDLYSICNVRTNIWWNVLYRFILKFVSNYALALISGSN